jgi:protein TonB
MQQKTRKALSWSVSLAIHATLLVLLLFVGFHFAVPQGSVNEDATTVEVVGADNNSQSQPVIPAAPEPEAQVQDSDSQNTDTEAEAAPKAEPITEQAEAEPAAAEPMDVEPKSDQTPTPEVASSGTSQTGEAAAPADQPSAQEGAQSSQGTPDANTTTGTSTGQSGPNLDESKLTEVAGNRKPDYPWTSRLRRQEGTVILKAFVEKDGTVTSTAIQQSSGFPLLDDEALKAYSLWKYQAGPSGWVLKPFKFSLK